MVTDIIIRITRLYQSYVSPLKGPTCRFYPTCSQYFIQSLTRYGLFKGFCLTLVRLLKCHPWHPGGYDPVR